MRYFIIGLVLFAVVACGEEAAEGINVPNTIKEVRAKHEAQLLDVPGVVSVGIGKGETGEPVIVIGVERDDHELLSTLPEVLEGYPVKKQVVGTIRAK